MTNEALLSSQPSTIQAMEPMMMLRTSAAVMTVIAAALVDANWDARVMVAGFVIFIIGSLIFPSKRRPPAGADGLFVRCAFGLAQAAF